MSADADILRLEGLFDSLDVAVLGLDDGLRVVFANDAAENLLGRSRVRLAGSPLESLEPLGPGLARVAARVGDDHAIVREQLVEGPRRLPVTATAWWGQGAKLGVALQIALPRTFEEPPTRTDVGVLAAGLAHEIRNPLAALRGAAELMASDVEQGLVPSSEYTDLILREAARMDALVGRILKLGRPPKLERVEVSVAELLHELAIEAKALARTRGLPVRIDEEYDPALPPLHVDRDRLFEALLNLVKNAVEALPGEGGTVTLGARVASEFRRREGSGRAVPLLRLTVVDQGSGLGTKAEKLFTPFFTTKPSGSGLGLLLARRAVEAHGGVLTLKERGSDMPGVEASVLLPLGASDG